MNYAHLHLLVNHFPIIGNVFSIALLLWSLIRNRREITRLALAVTIAVALSGYAADFTGGNAFDQVKELPGITVDALKAHAEAADLSLYFLYGTGVLALIGLILFTRNHRAAKIFIYLTFLLDLIASYFLYRAGYLGGLIRHPEITSLFHLTNSYT